MDPKPHPDLRWRRHDDGGLEVWLDSWPNRLGRVEPLRDGTWLAAVRPLQGKPEKAVIVGTRDEAVQRVVLWCRQRAWSGRPNANTVCPTGALGWRRES